MNASYYLNPFLSDSQYTPPSTPYSIHDIIPAGETKTIPLGEKIADFDKTLIVVQNLAAAAFVFHVTP
jgi:hypothetical protein